MANGYKAFDEHPWYIDKLEWRFDQRPSQDADFTTGVTYDGAEWDASNDAETKQVTRVKYVSRRRVDDLVIYKKVSGKKLRSGDWTLKIDTVGAQIPPPCYYPYDSSIDQYNTIPRLAEWYLISQTVDFQQDSAALMTQHWRRYFNWQLVQVQALG